MFVCTHYSETKLFKVSCVLQEIISKAVHTIDIHAIIWKRTIKFLKAVCSFCFWRCCLKLLIKLGDPEFLESTLI